MKRLFLASLAAILLALFLGGDARVAARGDRPSPTLSASPMIGVAPVKVRFKADLKGGADDDKEFYCPTVEWDWDDGTTSEYKRDCEPYEAGKTLIDRHFTSEHEFKEPGGYRVIFRLRRGNKALTQTTLLIQIR
jgi:hypothetical protein